MDKRLTDLLDPRHLNITLSDLAQGLQKSPEQVYFPSPKPDDEKPEDAWKWADLFLMVVKGEGGRFGSYRALQCWMDAVIQLLNDSHDWQTLAERIAIAEAELETYRYRDAHKIRLREVLAQQKIRLATLKEQATRLAKAWEWAHFWESVFKSCPNEESLNILLQVYKLQKDEFDAYPEVLDWVMQVGKARHVLLRGVG